MQRLAVLVTVTLFCGFGCAMSERRFGVLADEVSKRNDERYTAAERAFQAKGYSFADDEVVYAALTSEERRSCLTEGNGERPLSFQVQAPQGTDRPAPAALQLTAVAAEACRFFRNGSSMLEARKAADGSMAYVLHLRPTERVARDARGQLVVVAVSKEVLSRRTVLVKRSCDHMPGGDPPEFTSRLLVSGTPPARVTMVVQEEQLEVECTENTY